MILRCIKVFFTGLAALFIILNILLTAPAQAMSEEDLYFDAITLEDEAVDASDFKRAAKGYIKLLKKYPDSDNEELHGAALFALGEIWELHLNRPENAKWAFKEIARRFPDSSWTNKGRQGAARLSRVNARIPSELGRTKSVGSDASTPRDLSRSLAGLGIGTIQKPVKTKSTSSGRSGGSSGISGLGIGFDFAAKPRPSAQGKDLNNNKDIRGSRSTSGFSAAGLGFMPDNLPRKRADEYKNLIFGFNFPLPENDWFFTEDTLTLGDDCEVFVFKDFNKKKYDHVPNLNVMIKSFHQDVSVLSAAAIAKEEIQKLSDSDIETEKAVMKNKSMYFYRRFRYWSKDAEFITVQALTAKENLVYIITGTYTDVDAPEVEDDMWRMITDFSVR